MKILTATKQIKRISLSAKQKAQKLAELKKELRNPIKITFEDKGQDFLTWVIKRDGTIISCTPAQGWMWKQYKVTNLPSLYKGGKVMIKRGRQETQIKHKITSVESVDMPSNHKALVLEKHPKAKCEKDKDAGGLSYVTVYIKKGSIMVLGSSRTETAAWQDAYLTISKKK